MVWDRPVRGGLEVQPFLVFQKVRRVLGTYLGDRIVCDRQRQDVL